MNSNITEIKRCFVSYCQNSTTTTPEKMFIKVPTSPIESKEWFAAAKINPAQSATNMHCCEDHFDLPNDMVQLLPDTPKIMKHGVIPHKFENQLQKRKIITNEEPLQTPKKPKLELPIPITLNLTMKQKFQLNNHNKNKISSLFKSTNIQDIKSTALETTLNLIKKQSIVYIGIPKDSFYIVNILSKKINVDKKYVLLCLEKIKRDIGMIALANDFDTSKIVATHSFIKLIPKIAHELKKFIIWPHNKIIFQNLPRNFRSNYAKVQSIINCMEINIPEPFNKLQKSISWSEKSNSYTYKYLISCTPDGFINYVSGGFGGKISDSLMLEVAGFLDVVPPGSHVLGEGFKNIQELLLEKGCVLRRLPNIETGSLDTNRVDILKNHMNQVVCNFRKFLFLQPCNYIDRKFLCVLDEIVLIVAALINVQT